MMAKNVDTEYAFWTVPENVVHYHLFAGRIA